MIYRAIASSSAPHWSDRDAMERVVFFEASNRAEAHKRLKELLAAVWAVEPESLDYYNLADEGELLAESFGGEETGDHRLFEMGIAYGNPMYTGAHGQPLMLLQRNLDRLMIAYLTLPHRGETGLKIFLGKFE